MSKTKTAEEILIEIFGKDDVNNLIPYDDTIKAMKQYAQEKLKELQDLAIWMTGCGYDFTQHEHYQKNKHLLNQDND